MQIGAVMLATLEDALPKRRKQRSGRQVILDSMQIGWLRS